MVYVACPAIVTFYAADNLYAADKNVSNFLSLVSSYPMHDTETGACAPIGLHVI